MYLQKTIKYPKGGLTAARLIVFLLLVGPKIGLTQPANITFHHLTVDNGLPSGLIHCIYQDAYSCMWFGTDAGLCQFDGIKCRAYQYDPNDSFSLHGTHVYAINEDKQKKLWVLTEQGMNAYNSATDNFDFFAVAKLPNRPHVDWHIVPYSDSGVAVTISSLLFCTLNVYTKQIIWPEGEKIENTNTEIPVQRDVKYIAFDDPHRNIKLFYLNKNQLYEEDFSVKAADKKYKKLFLSAVAQVNDSVFWCATSNGLLYYNKKDTAPEMYKPPAVDNIFFTNIYYTNGMLWLGTEEKGLWVFDSKKRQFTAHYEHDATSVNSLAGNNAGNLIFADKKGNLWMDIFAKGIDYFNPQEKKFTAYFSDNEVHKKHMDNFIRALAQDSAGNIWCGTYNGSVYRLDNSLNITATYRYASRRRFHSIEKIMVDDKKRVWVLDDGLNLLDVHSDSFKRLFTFDIRTFAHDLILTAGHKLLFIDSTYSVAELHEAKGEFSCSQSNIKNVYNSLSVFFSDKMGRLYVNDPNGNILVYQKDKTQYGLLNKLPFHGYIKCYYENGATLWIGTTSGLIGMNSITFACRLFTQKNGLPENTVYGILNDAHGNLWMSTNKGISKFNVRDNLFKNYAADDGLQSNEFNTNAYLLCRDGEMWFGGVHGLNIFYPSAIKDDTIRPPVQINYFNVNDERYFGVDITADAAAVSLPYEQRTVSFNFTGIDYMQPADVQLQYRMTGIDPNWISTANPGFARYANLQPGTYKFEIRPGNKSGTWGAPVKTVMIFIATPFYQTWWFAALTICALCGLLYLWYSYRINQVKKLQMVRNRIARDLHDDIGSSISSIRIMSDMVQDSIIKSPVKSGELMNKIGNESQQVMDAIRDIVWTINPENDALGSMLVRMQEYAAEVLEAKQAEYVFEAGDNIGDIKLAMQRRRDLYLIFKEAVNNMAKYSQCTIAEIKLNRIGNKLVLMIKDNGIGFNEDENRKGNGLKNMRKRADQLNAKITLKSEKGRGTEIILQMPMP